MGCNPLRVPINFQSSGMPETDWQRRKREGVRFPKFPKKVFMSFLLSL